jgi:hypothetical protein
MNTLSSRSVDQNSWPGRLLCFLAVCAHGVRGATSRECCDKTTTAARSPGSPFRGAGISPFTLAARAGIARPGALAAADWNSVSCSPETLAITCYCSNLYLGACRSRIGKHYVYISRPSGRDPQ